MTCCKAMEYALAEGYLYCPMQMYTDGGSTGIRSLGPALHGPSLTKTGRKRKPALILAFCPWCGTKLENSIPVQRDES